MVLEKFILVLAFILGACARAGTSTPNTPQVTETPIAPAITTSSSTPTTPQTPTVPPTDTPTLTAAPALAQTPTSAPNLSLISFDGDKAYADVQYQVNIGPRTPGSSGHEKIIQWIKGELELAGWEVEVQQTSLEGHTIRNVIGKRGTGGIPWIILGAHYDTRLWADQDPNQSKRKDPVPGADDGASGVAVLLELARILPKDLDKQIWLVFFDLEDQGDIPGWDWILGSTAMAQSVAILPKPPDGVVVLDMIGDANLTIPVEANSDQKMVREIWGSASQLGYNAYFLPQIKYSMEDDHTPFLKNGIPAVDIIDFDYSYWHTTADTADKVFSEQSESGRSDNVHLANLYAPSEQRCSLLFLSFFTGHARSW